MKRNKSAITALAGVLAFVAASLISDVRAGDEPGSAASPGEAAQASKDAAAGSELPPRRSKLTRQTFPEHHFSVLLTPSPETSREQVTTSGGQSFSATHFKAREWPHGVYEVQVLTLPEHSGLSPLALDELCAKIAEGPGDFGKAVITAQNEISAGGNSGRHLEMSFKENKTNGAKARVYSIGRRVYILTASGTKPWLKSAAVNGFLDSLQVKGE
ncbi:MAG TPA: hypothetical protein V6D17_25210 [Candidatus Obscuribacterales bacterium]